MQTEARVTVETMIKNRKICLLKTLKLKYERMTPLMMIAAAAVVFVFAPRSHEPNIPVFIRRLMAVFTWGHE